MFWQLDNVSVLQAIKNWGYIPLFLIPQEIPSELSVKEANEILTALELQLVENGLVRAFATPSFCGYALTPEGQNYLTAIAVECVPLWAYERDHRASNYWIDQRHDDAAFFARELGGEG